MGLTFLNILSAVNPELRHEEGVMWGRRIGTSIVLATVAVAGGTAPAARAAAPGEPILADFNNDGVQDRAVLGAIHPNLCSLVIQHGSAPGVYLPPIAHTYERPGGPIGTDCPDIGTAFDADDDQFKELWLAWSVAVPPGLSYNRLVIDHNFRSITTYTSPQATPRHLGTADFGGDGVASPWSIGPGGYYTSQVIDGVVSPGLANWCSTDTPTAQHADLNLDQRMDSIVAYTDACADGSSGVVVLLATGEVQQLQLDPTGAQSWRTQVSEMSGDRLADIRTQNLSTGTVEYYFGSETGTLVRGPDANTDRVGLTSVKPLAIDVLANDYAALQTRVVVTVPPRYGTTQVLTDRRVLYRPHPQHGRTDRFTYQLQRHDRSSTAVVTVIFPPDEPR
ncbi:Ig-like domain-containing protein [Plantactinospora sp. B6F1]|uniref:Ig-like domain-containing protein n=1 Tax=Plantactinospora sp. B6F1 TaxID=3158971 RepID=UPI0032D99856